MVRDDIVRVAGAQFLAGTVLCVAAAVATLAFFVETTRFNVQVPPLDLVFGQLALLALNRLLRLTAIAKVLRTNEIQRAIERKRKRQGFVSS